MHEGRRRRGVQRRRRRSADRAAGFCALYKRHVQPVSIHLCAPCDQLPAVLRSGNGTRAWSEGQLPLVYNRREWHAYWKKTQLQQRKAEGAARMDAAGSDIAKDSRATFEAAGRRRRMLRVAIVGCGKIADAHASQIRADSGLRDRGGLRPRAADGAAARGAVPGRRVLHRSGRAPERQPSRTSCTSRRRRRATYDIAKLCPRRGCPRLCGKAVHARRATRRSALVDAAPSRKG